MSGKIGDFCIFILFLCLDCIVYKLVPHCYISKINLEVRQHKSARFLPPFQDMLAVQGAFEFS
jgi:hypothetical protein